ncbi:MAG: hypothetical protein AAFQ36_05960 [Pseudomonadota bacterium]
MTEGGEAEQPAVSKSELPRFAQTRRPKRDRSRRHDAALLVPLGGAIALLPPFAGFFARPGEVFGLPLVVVYLFGVWLAIILVSIRLTRLLQQAQDDTHDTER